MSQALAPSQTAGLLGRISPEARTSFYYFVSFTSSGAGVAYAGIWFAGRGLSPGEIGIVNALPIFLTLGLNLLVGRIADRASDWRSAIVAGALVSAAVAFGLFFATGFWGILLVWTAIALPVAVIAPVADAASLRMTKRNGTDFGTIRAFGTVGYMVFNAATGVIVSVFGAVSFVPLYVGLNVLRGVVALGLPRFRAPPEQPTVAAVPVAEARRLRDVMRPWFLLPLIGSATVFATHIILNAFSALLWKEQGISEALIGPLIALGAFAEAMTMFAYRRISARISARTLMLVAAGVATVRWLVMGFSPPVEVLVGLQLLQSLSFAVGLLGAVHFIAKWTSEDIAAEVQSLFVVLQQAMSVIALTGFGWLVGFIGAHAYIVAGGCAFCGGICIWASMRLKQPQPEPVTPISP
jgi:PPP family 3-phenylpropionic acid transporter